jgi:hypothetical protein
MLLNIIILLKQPLYNKKSLRLDNKCLCSNLVTFFVIYLVQKIVYSRDVIFFEIFNTRKEDMMIRKCALVFGVFIAIMSTSFAQSRSEVNVTDLARYYPANVQQWIGFRTDAEFRGNLETFLTRFDDLVEDGAILPSELLNALVAPLGGTFDEVLPWLGDSGAYGVRQTPKGLAKFFQDFIPTQEAIFTFAITDREATEDFIDERLAEGFQDYDKTTEGDFTVWTSDNDFSPTFKLNDEVWLISTFSIEIPEVAEEDSLAQSEDFLNTLALLPSDDYVLVAYLNQLSNFELQRFQISFLSSVNRNPDIPPLPEWIDDLLPSQVIGLSSDGDTLIIDVAQALPEGELGEINRSILPINDLVTQQVPSDALAFMHIGTIPSYGLQLESLAQTLDTLFKEQGGLSTLFALQEPNPRSFPATNGERVLLDAFATPSTMYGIANTTFSGLTGMSFTRDILPALDGDGLMYLRLLPPPRTFGLLPVTPDFVWIQNASNNERNTQIMDNLQAASTAYGSNYAIESINEHDAMVLDFIPRVVKFQELTTGQSLNLPNVAFADLLLANRGDSFVFGTRQGVTDYLNGEMTDNITETAAYASASEYFFENPTSIGVVQFSVLQSTITDVFRRLDQRVPDDVQLVIDALSRFDSAGLSTTITEEASLVRFTLTTVPASR